MLVLLDDRTWTSGEDTAQFVEHLHAAMRVGVHLNCIHEFPSVVGPPRHECEFGLMFGDDWTPAHLTGGPTNLYKEIAFALKGVEWRQPGLVAVASKLVGSAAPHKPIEVAVPDSYVPKRGPNKWMHGSVMRTVKAMVQPFDGDRDYIISADELHAILAKSDSPVSKLEAAKLYAELLTRFDANADGQLSVEEVALYVVERGVDLSGVTLTEAPLLPPAADKKPSSPVPPIPAGDASLKDKVDRFFTDEVAVTAEGAPSGSNPFMMLSERVLRTVSPVSPSAAAATAPAAATGVLSA